MPSLERILRPVHRWVWRDERRAARKLFTFAATEADGGRDLSRAAELTANPLLRRLFLRHAQDEQHHAELFRARGRTLLAALGHRRPPRFEAAWLAPGERGRDDLRVDGRDASLLAFLHLSERAAAGRFAVYRDVVPDEATREVFGQILRDEVFHMRYTRNPSSSASCPSTTAGTSGPRAPRASGRATCAPPRRWPICSARSSSWRSTS